MNLLRRGVKVAACIKKWEAIHPAVASLSQDGAVIRYRSPDSVFHRIARRLRHFPKSFLSKNRADLAVISEGGSCQGVEWLEACQELGIPYAAIIHVALPWSWPSDLDGERFRRTYAGAQRVYFVCEGNRELTRRQLDYDFANSKVIRNPFNVPYDAQCPWPPEDVARWGCVARLDTYIKGLDILLDVLDTEKWRNRPLHVTLYGSGGNETSLKRTVENRRLRNVTFAGQVPDPAEIWRREHCLILPSRAEGLPLVIVEAMLCGRPCIVTNVAGNAELLQDSVTGFIAESACANALDEAMERAWQNMAQWKSIGACAAISVRRFVPADPAQVFADELLSLMA